MTETVPTPDQARSAPAVSEDVLIIVPVRHTVLFPGVVAPLTVHGARAVAAVQEAVRTERKVGIVLQRDPALDEPTPPDLHAMGTVATLLRYVTTRDGAHHLIVQGEQRFRTLDYQAGLPFDLARVAYLAPSAAADTQTEARTLHLKRLALEALELLPQAPAELRAMLESLDSAERLADLVASFLDAPLAEKQAVLETTDLRTRLERVATLLAHRTEVLKVTRRIEERTRAAIDDRNREALLREQLKQIRHELGEDRGAAAELDGLREAVDQAGMPEDVLAHARKELARLERMPEQGAEYSVQLSYLELMAALPWAKLDTETLDVEAAGKVLEADHYGLEKIKRRIVEFLAVRKLNPEGRSPILCFVGPPGVGKTSLGQSVARATGLKFQRVSLGGVHDEAEIRGHRRTYVGALPGSILQAVRRAGTRNPVLLLDEVDKLGRSLQGDPAAALLEVLDPEQNSTFRDNYLGVDFDLSKVLFIVTANVQDTIPAPLRDRMEIIELGAYTEDEKLEIARRFLVRRQREANGLKPEQIAVDDAALTAIIRDYTREAGCRNLEREIGALMRNAAMKIASNAVQQVRIAAETVPAVLGAPRFENEVALRVAVPGVATGLAWTPAGGDILFIESARTEGSGRLILTGQLGDVMKESAQAAVSLVKSNAAALGIAGSQFEKSDIHIHVPAGAIPKDGPSAGTAIYLSLVSLLTGRRVAKTVAVTGEISLRGLVLPVGGIREKVVAAARAGIRTVILPARNRKDLEDIPASVRDALTLRWVSQADEVVALALEAEREQSAPAVGLPA